MRKILLGLMILFIISVSLYPQQALPTQSNELENIAKEFVNLLVQENFSAAVKTFDATMSSVMPPKTLQETWTALIKQVGIFKKQISTRKEKYQQYDFVFVTCQFERATLDIKVVFDSNKKVAGLFFVPSQPSYSYPPPPYAKSDSYKETDVVVKSGKWELPGTLTIPNGKGPFPAVILVHGSGPQDRDETIGPNKSFRDLAFGLASSGIAVLRYEKRTKQYAKLLAQMKESITVNEETIEDALSAVTLLRETSSIDRDRIFVLGHSLGGMLIPRIGQKDTQITGFIIMAGTNRPLEDVILEQLKYIFSLDNQIDNDEQKQLDQLKQQVALVKSQNLSKETSSDMLPFGAPASYWLDLRGYDPAKEVASLKAPILILQGQRDYQATMDDYKRWKDTLSSRQDVQFKLYPTLNHLFIAGEGRSEPAEYEKAGYVDKVVIDDISNWIKSSSKVKATQ